LTRERPDVAAVGLTGGIGAGKSTALGFFAEAGAVTLSADVVVHQLYARPEVKRALAEHFAPEVLDLGGEVDRRWLAQAVHGQPEQRGWLESLTHPLVGEEIMTFIRDAPAGAVVVCEVPLLFEAGMNGLFDLVITVEAGSDARRRRSVHAFGPDVFEEFEALQASTERRVAGSDLAFVNDGNIEHLRAFVGVAYARAHALAVSAAATGEGR
jgi:dephospho-CoA kinase